MVRIHFPPAVSHSLQVDFTTQGECGRFCPRAYVNCDVRERYADGDRARLGPFSLSAIDAVPPGKKGRPLQRYAECDRARGSGLQLINLRAVRAARSSRAADRGRSAASR